MLVHRSAVSTAIPCQVLSFYCAGLPGRLSSSTSSYCRVKLHDFILHQWLHLQVLACLSQQHMQPDEEAHAQKRKRGDAELLPAQMPCGLMLPRSSS